jgi:hypothetical protein
MDGKPDSTIFGIISEHNRLNGLGFVVVEFLIVVLAALLIAAGAVLHRDLLLGAGGTGIALNGLAVLAIAGRQIRRGEADSGLLGKPAKSWADAGRQNPKLGAHTAILTVAILVPFLLILLLAFSVKRRDAE